MSLLKRGKGETLSHERETKRGTAAVLLLSGVLFFSEETFLLIAFVFNVNVLKKVMHQFSSSSGSGYLCAFL